MIAFIKGLLAHLGTDSALGVVGGGLAVASVGFGVYMNVHGPITPLGQSKDFSVFAQFAAMQRYPNYKTAPEEPVDVQAVAAPPQPQREQQQLDMNPTATIPGEAAGPRNGPPIGLATSILPAVSVRAAGTDSATIVIDGRERTVRIGDTVPNAGEVLEIWPGRKPTVRTSYGLIISRGP